MIRKHGPLLLAIAALIGLGLFAGWYFFAPKHIVETAAPAVRQADGSTIVERAPDAKARPVAQIPKGARLERNISLTVRPETPPANLKLAGAAPCPPVRVDMSLVRMPDRTRRVVASSPNGEIVGGLDVPVDAAPGSESKHWAAGLSWSPITSTAGVWVERDIGRVRIGAEMQQARPLGATNTLTSTEVRLRAGFTF